MSDTNKQIKREIDLLLEKENISFFAFSIYLEHLGDDSAVIRHIVITVGGEALSNDERLRAANILIDIGRKLKRQVRYKDDACIHCEHMKGEHSIDGCEALVNGKRCACRGYEEID